MDIEDKLIKLCELLQDGRIKSKQAAFDETISKVITEKTGTEYKPTIISNMFRRTKRKGQKRGGE